MHMHHRMQIRMMHLDHLHHLRFPHRRRHVLDAERRGDALVPLGQHGGELGDAALALRGGDAQRAVGVEQVVDLALDVGQVEAHAEGVEGGAAFFGPDEAGAVGGVEGWEGDVDVGVVLA